MAGPDQKYAMLPIFVKRKCEEWIGKPNGERKDRYETCDESDDESRFLHCTGPLLLDIDIKVERLKIRFLQTD